MWCTVFEPPPAPKISSPLLYVTVVMTVSPRRDKVIARAAGAARTLYRVRPATVVANVDDIFMKNQRPISQAVASGLPYGARSAVHRTLEGTRSCLIRSHHHRNTPGYRPGRCRSPTSA